MKMAMMLSAMTITSFAGALSPPPINFKHTEVTVEVDGKMKTYELDFDGKKLMIHERADKESPRPLIVKINRLTYLIYNQGKIVIRKVVDGAEDLFDKFYGIQKPPDPPKGGDNGNGWKPDKPDRWDYRP